MKIYAELPVMRSRQLLGDAAIVLWSALWIWIGYGVYRLFDKLGGPGRIIQRAGEDFQSTLLELRDEASEVPVVGSSLQEPIESASNAGRVLAQAGQTQQDIVHSVAIMLGVLFALLPILYALWQWLPGRLRWIREASAAHRIRIDAEDLYLFALRAVATRPLPELLRATPDPAHALASGDYAALAAVELKDLGLRPDRH
jgi:hypothetical protein